MKKEEKKLPSIPPSLHEVDDFLDVNYLEKSLQKRFSQPISSQVSQLSQEDDNLNIDKLEEGLIKFEQSQKRMSKNSSELNKIEENILK